VTEAEAWPSGPAALPAGWWIADDSSSGKSYQMADHHRGGNTMLSNLSIRRQQTGAAATAASVTGAMAVGARILGPSAMGPLAIAVAAVGAIAIGRLAIADAVIKKLRAEEIEIRSLKVGELEVAGQRWPGATAPTV
jgi:hypothetical protein